MIYEGVKVRVLPLPILAGHWHNAEGVVDRWVYGDLYIVELEGTCRGIRALLYSHEMEEIT